MAIDMKQKLTELHGARTALGVAKARWEEFKAAFEQDHVEYLEDIDRLKDQIEDCEDEIRAAALEHFDLTGEKKVCKGVGVREKTILSYDPTEALEWAKAHNLTLALNTKAFEKLAKVDPPDFVEVLKVHQPTIARDLQDAVSFEGEAEAVSSD